MDVCLHRTNWGVEQFFTLLRKKTLFIFGDLLNKTQYHLVHQNEIKKREREMDFTTSLSQFDEQVYKKYNRWALPNWAGLYHLLTTTRHWEIMMVWTLTRYKHTLHILYFTSVFFLSFSLRFFILQREKWRKRDSVVIHSNLVTIIKC